MVLTNLEILEKLVMLQRVRLTSTGASSSSASAADIIDVTSGSIVLRTREYDFKSFIKRIVSGSTLG
jgi:hypothetical protein